MFKRHKHTWHLLGAQDLYKEPVILNGVLIHQDERTTAIVEQCDTCPKIKETIVSGNIADAVKRNYK